MCLHPSRDLPPPPPTPDLLQPVLGGNPHKVGSCGSIHCRPHCLMLSCPIPGDRSLIVPAFLWRREKGGGILYGSVQRVCWWRAQQNWVVCPAGTRVDAGGKELRGDRGGARTVAVCAV